ncbi:hypothetical protein llap_8655 [Limosa lapponica baueri]|uniref:Uncharacterized protein n=1 Tax=Limosa lapponica baueri TaxID=1758121 RepID=A0A2I0U4N1_LIMLA|nr:hypothetical protein llap_8655 [Limosa lapponica baueri]
MCPGTWYYNDLFGSFWESAENGVPQGQTPPGHRQGDATCPLESIKRARQRKAAGHKSRSWLANIMIVTLCYTLSGGILLKGYLEKQEHLRRKVETKETKFMLGSAESSLRPPLCDKLQVAGHTEHCLVTTWQFGKPGHNDFTLRFEGVQHLIRSNLNDLNKLQHLDLKSPREGGLNSVLFKMGDKSNLLERYILSRYYSNSDIKDYLSC